jgi:hypothetical protein
MRDSENSPRRAVVRVTDQLAGPIQSRKPNIHQRGFRDLLVPFVIEFAI